MKRGLFSGHRELEEKLKIYKKKLEDQAWGLQKTNDAIKLLYNDLAEKNKRLRELDQLKSDFVATVSHELRTPLTIMKEFALILSDEIKGPLNKEQREYIGIITHNIDRLSRLIEDLLDISKIESGKVSLNQTFVDIVDVAKGVASLLTPAAEEKHIELKTLFPKSAINIYLDHDKIVQVFTNLIMNAIKFTPENARVSVEITERPEEVECCVSDTGIGIAPENMNKLFTKFQQFDRQNGIGSEGAGLGLAITKGLIQMHKGRIWAESSPGKGSRFIFTLPRKQEKI